MEQPVSQAFDLPTDTWRSRLIAWAASRRMVAIWLGLILLLGAALRFTGVHWDSGHRLHPDERFMVFVTNDIRWPENWDTYFDPAQSPLSPYALPNMGLYVYGTLPLYVVKFAAIQLNMNTYDTLAEVGRVASGMFDLAAIVVLFLIGRRLYGNLTALLGSALLALSVLNIQLAHFYTVDSFANLFILLVAWFGLRAAERGRLWDYAAIGLALGAGMATKISALTAGLIVVLALGRDLYIRWRNHEDARAIAEHAVVRIVALSLITLLTFRILQPISFSGPEFWNFTLNPTWTSDIEDQGNITSGEADIPPGQQWTNRAPILFPLENMLLWGMGLPLGLAAWAGWALAAWRLVRRREVIHLIPVFYVGVTFLYHAVTWTKFMRYFLPIYPFLALLAAYLIVQFWRYVLARRTTPQPEPAETLDLDTPRTPLQERIGWLRNALQTPRAAAALTVIVFGGTLLYALAFTSIYTRPHSRVEASRWIMANIPYGTTLATEHWDDALPLAVDGRVSFGPDGYQQVDMPNYEDDTPEKLDRMIANLTQAEYVILSSNRLYDSLTRIPVRYPMTTRYYELLKRGDLGFRLVYEGTSYPQLFGIQIPDQSSEESFTVYDHPRVLIYRKTATFNPDEARRLLTVDWATVQRLTPRQYTEAPSALLLSQNDRTIYRQAAETNALFTLNSPDDIYALAIWITALLVIGVLTFPITWIIFRAFDDHGYLLARTLGTLLIGWGAWIMASLRIMPFTWWSISVVILLLGSAWFLIVRQQRSALLEFWRTRRGLIIGQEAIFWGFFAAMTVIRMLNPDLWHPAMGGEKPMDLAYLTAITHSPYFPSYDPWYAGGYINYYYFGFVLIGMLIHITGIPPHVAYNLAIPTMFALTAGGALCVAYNLSMRLKPQNREQRTRNRELRWGSEHGDQSSDMRSTDSGAYAPTLSRRAALGIGTLAALFVTTLGNLGQVKLMVEGFVNLSGITLPEGKLPNPFDMLGYALSGMVQWLFNGRELNFRTEWWYWNATRVIPAPPTEAGPITEFPFFTFLYGDLHAHMMALPYTLLALGLILALLLGPRAERTEWWERGAPWGAMALTLGALWPINTWDFPTYAALLGVAIFWRDVARRGTVTFDGLISIGVRLVLTVAAGYALFLPFHQSYATAYSSIEAWEGSRTPFWAYLVVHGFFLFVLISYLLGELMHGRELNAVARLFRLRLRYWRRPARLHRLRQQLVRAAPLTALGVTFGQTIIALVVALALIGQHLFALGIGVLALVTLLIIGRPNPLRQFTLSMIGLGMLLTLVVELVVLKGDISRMNTVFKFYLQVWVLWSVAAAAALPLIAARLWPHAVQPPRPARIQNPDRPWYAADERTSIPLGVHLRQAWWWAFTLLIGGCALYPLTATPVRAGDRFEGSTAITLDGTAYMRSSLYLDEGRPVVLAWDQEAMRWLRDNIVGIPVIAEAVTPLYRWGSRVSVYTGMPTVVGWDWHQRQQRAILPGDLVDRRAAEVRELYSITDQQRTVELLRRYNIAYIYVGTLERLYGTPEGIARFEIEEGNLWERVYQNQDVAIYRVQISQQ